MLSGVVTAPTLRIDGSVVEKQGYDQKSGLFLSLKDIFPKVPESPTREQAQEALARLKSILKNFPFESVASKSVILAGFLTAAIRRSLPAAPAIGVTAPTMGTGKSLLSDLIAIIATGEAAIPTSLPFEEAEIEKRLLAMLMAGAPVLAIDNIESHVRSAALCTILTQSSYKARILGVSKEAAVQTNILVLLNGNNLVIRGDMTTRVILCSLDAQDERPQARKFDVNPKVYVKKNRAQMITDILTIIRAYIVSGEQVDIQEFGRFESWSRFVREPLVWLGCCDPLDTIEEIEKNDPVRVAHTLVLTALSELYEEKTFQAKDAVKVYGNGTPKQLQLRQAAYDALESAVQSLKGLNARTCGILFRQMEKRVYNGMRLIRAGQYQGTETWRVEHINDNSGGSGQIKPTRES